VIGQQVPRGGGGGEILWFHSVTVGGTVAVFSGKEINYIVLVKL
jgi:hypothetical protein